MYIRTWSRLQFLADYDMELLIFGCYCYLVLFYSQAILWWLWIIYFCKDIGCCYCYYLLLYCTQALHCWMWIICLYKEIGYCLISGRTLGSFSPNYNLVPSLKHTGFFSFSSFCSFFYRQVTNVYWLVLLLLFTYVSDTDLFVLLLLVGVATAIYLYIRHYFAGYRSITSTRKLYIVSYLTR